MRTPESFTRNSEVVLHGSHGPRSFVSVVSRAASAGLAICLAVSVLAVAAPADAQQFRQGVFTYTGMSPSEAANLSKVDRDAASLAAQGQDVCYVVTSVVARNPAGQAVSPAVPAFEVAAMTYQTVANFNGLQRALAMSAQRGHSYGGGEEVAALLRQFPVLECMRHDQAFAVAHEDTVRAHR